MKTIIIGLDGASFELIDPWIKQGALPNIASIKRDGIWADMESVLPPVTSPNWKCFSTGRNPGKLGIFWWENIDWTNRRVYYPTARKSENKEIWDYIGDAGMKVGIIGMPNTYPPKKVNGFLVAGGPDAQEQGFTYPAELEKELKKQGWRNNPQEMLSIAREKSSQETHEIIDRHFKIANILRDKYELDFLMVAVFHSNSLQHFLWNAPETKKAWEIIDKQIGEFVKQDSDIIVMSDHGSNKITEVFNINTWLEQEGYLSLNLKITSIIYRLGITRRNLITLLSQVKARSAIRKLVPNSLWERLYAEIPNETGEIMKKAKTSKVDWKKSKALASGQGPIYLNPRNKDNDRLKKEIKQKLENLVSPSTGDKIVEKVYSKEEIYHGKYLNEAPDLIIDQAKGVHIPGGIGQRGIFDSPQRWKAENKKIGLFMAYGPNIKKAGKIDNISILDLAPTILHLMNITIPNDMDGRVLKEIFRENSLPAKSEVKSMPVEIDEPERVKKKVKWLKDRMEI